MTDQNETMTGNFNFDLPKNRSNVIKVIGIGGGGGNAINYMFQQGIVGVDFVICNTDAQALDKSAVPIKIQLGASLTEGLGAGANPDVGKRAAQESIEEVRTLLSTQTKMVFLTAGMGGGTGTGAAPIIAGMAKAMDILTVGIVTMPFQFEGKIRLEQAQRGLEELKSNVDALIVINNNKLREVYGNLGFKAGFAKADEVLATAARGIAEVITHHYTQNIDLKDAKTVLSNSGSAIMGSATAEGANRAQESIVKALDSPLLNDNKITGCKNVLLLIVSGEEEITIDEIGEINDFIQTEAGNNTNIIMGVGEDPSLGNSISVTIIATGFNSEQQHQIVNTEAKKIIHALEEEQPLVQDLTEVKPAETIFDLPKTEDTSVTEEEAPIIHHLLEEDEEEVPTSIHDIEVIDHVLVEPEITNEPTEQQKVEPLIETTPEIAAIEVEAEAIGLPVEEEVQDDAIEAPAFIINEINTGENQVEDLSLMVEDEQQIQFDFELPLQQEPHRETTEPVKSTFFALEEEVKDEEVSVNELVETTEQMPEEALVLKTIETPVPEDIAAPSEEVKSPFDQSISESISQQNEKRKAQLKQFNYTFKNSLSRVEEMERQPAYKRMGFELEASAEDLPSTPSSLSVDNDSNDEIQLRSNNSFLHDNVD